MKAKQRGNAMLISAILVFGLTVTALGVSRMLVKGMQGAATQREFLGVQAHQICEAAVWRWIRGDGVADRTSPPAFKQYTDFMAGKTGGGADVPVAANVVWQAMAGNVYRVSATASVSSSDTLTTVERRVVAMTECPPSGNCSAWAFTEWTP